MDGGVEGGEDDTHKGTRGKRTVVDINPEASYSVSRHCSQTSFLTMAGFCETRHSKIQAM